MSGSDCPLCELADNDLRAHADVWSAFATTLRNRDATRVARARCPERAKDISAEVVWNHLENHHYVQPGPPGDMDRQRALQEALNTFSSGTLFLLRAVLRAQALSKAQIHAMFCAGQDGTPEALQKQMDEELRRLTFRSFLYRHWPENRGVMSLNDPGPYYYLNRQAIPIVEHLEGYAPKTLPATHYTTNFSGIDEFELAVGNRFNEVIVALRSKLYRRTFLLGERELAAFVAIEHWHSGLDLRAEVTIPNGSPELFEPATLLGVRVQTRDKTLDTMLPMWLDYDRGGNSPSEAADDFLWNALYYQSPSYKERFPRLAEHHSSGPLIAMTETPYRRDEVVAALRAKLAGRLVPIYVVDRPTFVHDPYAQSLLTPVSGDADRRYSLMDRLFAHGQVLVRARAFGPSDLLSAPMLEQLLAAKAPQLKVGAFASGASTNQKPDATLPFNIDHWVDAEAVD